MKVMAWNLENFKLDLRWPRSFKTPLLMKALYPDPQAPNTPAVDVFGVIEVYNRARGGPAGKPLPNTSLGAQGCLRLLAELQARPNDGATEWRLVVPLSLGVGRRDEAVGVFYNAKKVTFKGPNQWDEDKKEALPPPLATKPGPLPGPWTQPCSIAPDFFAPRVRFYSDAAYQREITFPDASHRRPCLTCFEEVGGRKVDLFFFHTSPPLRQDPDGPQNPAFLACGYLATIREVIEPASRPGVSASVVIGDFNVNADNRDRWNNTFAPLVPNTHAALLRPTKRNRMAVPTMQRERAHVIVPPAPIPNPVCDMFYWRRYAVDNALYRPSNLPRRGNSVDLTRGTDAQFAAWQPVTAETIQQIVAEPPVIAWQRFTAIRNWYQNRLRSDHMPIVIEV